MKTIEIIEQVAQSFEKANLHYGHGTDNAWDEAVALVLYVLDLPFHIDEKEAEKEISQFDQEKILKLADRRIKENKPLPYLTNAAYFAGLPFYIDERVIIPRSPFAELIEQGFAPWINPEEITQVLDLCTGSGCMAIAAALALPNISVDAVDNSKDALDVAMINLQKYELEDRVNLIESDLFSNVPQKKYDVIMSNPPYVSQDEMKALPQEFHHEPHNALHAEDEGLEIVLKILKEAPNYLSKNGILIVEVGNSQEALEKRLPNVPFTWLEFERGGEGVFILGYSSLICLPK